MSKNKLSAYRGRLTPAQIAAGMNVAEENAFRLASDAETLLKSGSYATAASIAALSIEESGKVSILRALAVANSDDEVRECWKNYRSHTRKNVAWIFPDLVAQGACKLDDFRHMFSDESDHPSVLDHLKQLGFYTDCLGNAHWSCPGGVIDNRLAQALVACAKLLSRSSSHTEREIELWIEHVGPVWKKDMAWMKRALVDWQTAMHKEGLSTIPTEAMQNFVRGA